ncbi:MAG: prolyl oligopeptidase family serine peptidase [Acidobacteriota bacterium]
MSTVPTTRILVAVGALLAASTFLVAQGRRPLTTDDLFELKSVSDPRISPDGAWVAFTVSSMDRKEDSSDTDVYMVAAAGSPALRLTSSSKPESSPRWSPDGKYLAFLSARDGKSQVYLLDRRGGEAQKLTDVKMGVSSFAWSPDSARLAMIVSDPDPANPEPEAGAAESPRKPKPIVITRRQFMQDGAGYLNDVRRHIHIFDLSAKTATQITSDRWDDSQPVWSPDGKLLAFSANRTADPDANQNNDIFVIEPVAGATPRTLTTSAGSDTSPVFSPDGKSIAYLAGGEPKDIWYAVNALAVVPVNGGPPRELTRTLDRNVSRPQFTTDGAAVLVMLEDGGNGHLARVPLDGAPLTRILDGERDVSAFDVAPTGDVALLQSQAQQPGEVHLLRRAAATPTRLTGINDTFLSTITLGSVERFKARSPDGTMIDVFLTRPPAANAKSGPLPTILRIHGGPVSQYSTAFNLEWQMLAAHGYAIVAANPRGSSGYGRDFSRAIWADWGNKDYEDVMAAVDEAVARGVADPARLGVGGWSYGGILTNYVISKTTRFKAAVSGASEFNYLANYGTDHYQRQWEAELGLPWANPELWMKLSPFYRMDRIVTPTLVLGGEDDRNVPIIGGQQLYQGLKRLGRDTELIIYPGETHSIRRPSFQKDRLDRYVAWYGKHLKGDTSVTRARLRDGG